MIYFIRAGSTPWIKIGTARDVTSRLGFLQVGNHERLSVVAVIDGGADEERGLHWVLRGAHRRGEWFRATEEIVGETIRLAELGTPAEEMLRQLITYREDLRARNALLSTENQIRYYRRIADDPSTGRVTSRWIKMFRLPDLERNRLTARAARIAEKAGRAAA